VTILLTPKSSTATPEH